jgi:hypothetical protein
MGGGVHPDVFTSTAGEMMMRKLTAVLAILSAIVAGCATQPTGSAGMSESSYGTQTDGSSAY